MKIDLLKIGVFLIGISAIIAVFVLVVSSVVEVREREPWKVPFHAFCSEKGIIITAGQDLESVKVLDYQNQIVCSFNKILTNSEELCIVGFFGFYLVEAGGRRDVVECREWQLQPLLNRTSVGI